ncbi:tripartite tricarboxylate transporter TctB family protein [Flaviflagellibacter deserti]|uniref:Tripartite tricarboxylate transporter TctB family protein n=1 Tax=Flaviflagellibacter deserti TaxID=2267266 RepID=A0ABV9YYS4_9HYPH
MSFSIRSPKDIAVGLFYVGLGAAAVFIARDYPMGTAGRMGPGYFPSLIGSGLVLLGLTAVLRSFLTEGDPVDRVHWRPLLLISASIVVFALMLSRLGLVVDLALLIAIAALARNDARLSVVGSACAAFLIAFCAIVFVKGLGLPIPLFGTWLGA